MINEILVRSSVLKIGNVTAVEGRFIKVNVDKTKNASHILYKGHTLKNVSVGSYIKICKGFERIIGKIEGEFIIEERQITSKEYKDEKAKVKRVLNVSLLGFLNNGLFERGIKELPLIDNECYLLDDYEFDQVHHFTKSGDDPILLGYLSQEKRRSISVGVNSLFACHIGIFGNTGSGKSYTLAKIYRQLFLKYKDNIGFKKNANFFLIDFNGEYINEFDRINDNIIIEAGYKNTFRLSTRGNEGDTFPVSSEAINDTTIWMIFLEATEKTQTPFIRRSLKNENIKQSISSEENLRQFIIHIARSITTTNDKSLDKNLFISFLYEVNKATHGYSNGIRPLIVLIEDELKYHTSKNVFYIEKPFGSKIYSDNNAFIEELTNEINKIEFDLRNANELQRIHLKFIFNYYDEIVRGFSNKEHLAPLLKRLEKRIGDISKVIRIVDNLGEALSKNFTIISLKEVNIHMRKILPLLFCKQLYEEKKLDDNRATFLNIIIDEAHNILSSNSQRESELWKDYRLETFEEIIKEGRKFGVFLTISSQRPYDISPTILSQLHNYFLHRLINNNDIHAIERTVSYLDKVSFESLPILPTGTCILAGLAAHVPIIVEIEKIEGKYKPFNQTIEPSKFWNKD